jgi:hypothetical protein
MSDIPNQVDSVISEVYRRGNAALLPRTDTALDKYDNLLASLFPDFQIINITEFDYGASFRYLIVLSADPDAGKLNTVDLLRAAQRTSSVDRLDLAISAIAPFCLIEYVRNTYRNGALEEQRSDNPFDAVQARATEKLLSQLGLLGICRLENAVGKIVVKDVQTDSCDLGDATVADCLFFGLENGYQ